MAFDNLILHNCGVTIIDYYSVEKVDDNSCRFSFFHHYPVNGGILINYVERYLVGDMDAIKKGVISLYTFKRTQKKFEEGFLAYV